MFQGKTLIVILATLIVGFTSGFVLRPIVMPPVDTSVAVVPATAPATAAEARGTQYFMAHVGEARQVVAGCRDGSVRGGECINAEEAIIKVDAAVRRKRFLGN